MMQAGLVRADTGGTEMAIAIARPVKTVRRSLTFTTLPFHSVLIWRIETAYAQHTGRKTARNPPVSLASTGPFTDPAPLRVAVWPPG